VSVKYFPIEAGHIMMFARAIGDANPIYHGGADFLEGRSRVIAPPTFVEASMHYDPVFPYRPRLGHLWFGSGREPRGGDPPPPAAGPAGTTGTSFHAETHLEYFGLLRPGDVLRVSERPGETWDKKGGRGGRLWFSSRVAEFATRDHDVVVRCTTVGVSTERKIEPAASAAPLDDGAKITPAAPSARHAQDYPVPAVHASELAVGTAREMLLMDNLTRGQILLYAGASGDFSPQHTDEIWNTKVAGYPTIFAHGMLTMGMTGRLLTDWFGDGHLRRFGLRFARQVWPGDRLIARGEVDSIRPDTDTALVDLRVQTTNGRGEMIASGYATVEVAT
jgi:acyl dehydratase